MAEQKAFLHVGLPHSGGHVLMSALRAHADTLADLGVQQPASSEDEMFRAAVEIRRDHRAWGLRRKDVEGVWSRICRRAYRTRDTVVVGHDLLAGCSADEVALLVDRLPGFAVHVVVTVAPPDARVAVFPDDQELAGVLRRWSTAVKSPGRVHVIVTDPTEPAPSWRALGDVVGFDATALPLPVTEVPPLTDPHAMRVLASSTGELASYDDLLEVADAWRKVLADEGYDVHGDTALLTPRSSSADRDAAEDERLAAMADALSESVAELARLREHARELAERNEKLERKRRKLKRRLAEAG